MRALPTGPGFTCPPPRNVTARRAGPRPIPAGLVSSVTTDVTPPDWVVIGKARVRPSAVQETGCPEGLSLPIQGPVELAEPGQAQFRGMPFASVMIAIWSGFRARASLLPSGDTPMPFRVAAGILGATWSAVSRAVRAAGSNRSRKNTTGVVLSRCSAGSPRVPDAMGQ